MIQQPSDLQSVRYPVSIKGVVIRDGKVLLLKNERNEWELPGGKLEPNETPMDCVKREILEETSISVEVTRLLDVHVYNIPGQVDVLIVAYECYWENMNATPQLSHEHKQIAMIALSELDVINIPDGYRKAIRMATGAGV